MKKITSLLLAVLMVCTMMTFTAVPAFAEGETEPATTTEYVANSWEDAKNYIEQSSGDITIVFPTGKIDVRQTIEIDHPCTITIKMQNSFSSLIGYEGRAFVINSEDVTLNLDRIEFLAYDKSNDGSVIYITENGDDFVINGATFWTYAKPEGDGVIYSEAKCTINNVEFHGGITNDGDGGAVYLDAEGCTVSNCTFEDCHTQDGDGGAIYLNGEGCTVSNCTFKDCDAETNGGAIFVNKDDCKILKSTFKNCASEYDGGAIYVGVSVDDCEISDCNFSACCSRKDDGGAIAFGSWCSGTVSYCSFDEACTAGDEGHWIYGDGDATVVKGCTQIINDNCIVDCSFANLTASVLSDGNLWIIIAVAVIAIAGIAALVIVKKKKKPALASGASDSDEE